MSVTLDIVGYALGGDMLKEGWGSEKLIPGLCVGSGGLGRFFVGME